jgi:hypothetical protein
VPLNVSHWSQTVTVAVSVQIVEPPLVTVKVNVSVPVAEVAPIWTLNGVLSDCPG